MNSEQIHFKALFPFSRFTVHCSLFFQQHPVPLRLPGCSSLPQLSSIGPHTGPGAGIEVSGQPSTPTAWTDPAKPLHWGLADAPGAWDAGDVVLAERSVSVLAHGFAAPKLEPPVPTHRIAAEVTEDTLDLSTDERRDIQLRLSLLGYDTQGIDGIFGAQTRTAIRAAQRDLGREPTGYMDADLRTSLIKRSRTRYVSWQAKRRAERVAAARNSHPTRARVPVPRNAPNCRRDADGKITENQSFSCDLAILGESLAALF